ncbi:MAG: ATP-binding cassette domain-containing protein [Polyangiales bacterium]|jgi:phospholipid/cholesterol/gamma-HCH transport system ATP-binding protein
MKFSWRDVMGRTPPSLPPHAKEDPIHVRIRDLHKSYGNLHVLQGVSLDVYRGKTNLIIGPSGSGKTVLMRQLIRLEKPDSGQLLVNGIDFARLEGLALAALRRTFGMVFQMSALFDSMTVFDNVAFPLREHTSLSRKEVSERVMDRLAALGIAAAAQKLPAELSGGMQKRVAVARAMILESEILIYDEPTTGLDPITTEMVDDLIVEAQELFGVTSIVISHDMASVVRIADRLSFLHEGKIVETGTLEDLLHSDDPATAEFMKASRVTFE